VYTAFIGPAKSRLWLEVLTGEDEGDAAEDEVAAEHDDTRQNDVRCERLDVLYQHRLSTATNHQHLSPDRIDTK